MLRLISVFFLALASLFAAAEDPVQWTLTFDSKAAPPGSHILAKLTGTIQPHWHVYSMTTPPGGPNPTKAGIADNPAVAGFKIYQSKPVRKLDPSFGIDTETFSEQYVLLFDVELKKDAAAGPTGIAANVRYQSCNDTICLPPKKKTAMAAIAIDPSVKAAAIAIPADYTMVPTPVPGAASTSAVSPATETAPTPPGKPAPAGDFGLFLITAFAAGVAAIFTPCVFPMIPFTVSYFLNRQTGGKRDGILHATVFCLGIVVLFTGLGALMKGLAGPFGVVQLGNSPWVNGFIAAVFVVFGLSLLGAYELTLPSGLLTKMNRASEGGGYLGTLLMGLTFTLTSFACIGPFVGPLLAASVQSSTPVFGMAAFATGLAAPFFVLALFPAFLHKLPRSGGWLMRVKVVAGFVVLAIAMKYLSSADQILQTDLISREVFLASWVVLFALPGLYLLGLLRLEGIKPEDTLGVGRVLIAALFLTFSISLLPGLFGASLGNVEAFIPVQAKGVALLGGGGGESAAPVWMKNQYKEALAKARAENKLVFINFTGYACTNCHWMKANMFPRPEITGLLKDFVLVDLYTDGTDAASEQNQQLEEKRFGTVAIPFYAIVDPDERTVATFPGLTRNASEFVGFLKSRETKVASRL